MIMAAEESAPQAALRDEAAETVVAEKKAATVVSATESAGPTKAAAGSDDTGAAGEKDATAKQKQHGHKHQRGGRGPRRGGNMPNVMPMMPGAYPRGWFPMPPQPMMPPRVGPTGRPQGDMDTSKINLYVSGLAPTTTDDELMAMFAKFGPITSAKAILDRDTAMCKGFGFVLFKDPQSAQRAVMGMRGGPVTCSFAKENYSDRSRAQEQDSTNLYMANLPPTWAEADLQAMLCQHGTVVSTRILRDQRGLSRGVGFARMETREQSEAIIRHFGRDWIMPGCVQPLQVRYADNSAQKQRRQERNFNKMKANGAADPSIPMSVLPPGQAMMMAMPPMMQPAVPASPNQAAAYPYAMPMAPPPNWVAGQMYAMAYGLGPAGAAAADTGRGEGTSSVSPTAMQQVTSQLQSMSLNSTMMGGPGQIAMVPMYAPQNYYGQYPMVPQQQQQQQQQGQQQAHHE